MQPIANPVETIDATIGSGAVAGSQIERAVFERIGLDHHYLVVRVAVVLVGSEGYVAIDARKFLEVVEIADDLRRLGADVLHRLGDHPWTVIAQRDPPKERVSHVDLGALQTVDKSVGAIRELSARGVANRPEVVRVYLGPIFRLFEQRLGLAGAECGL